MKLILIDYDLLNCKYGEIKFNSAYFSTLTKASGNILTLVSNKCLDIMMENKRMYGLSYDYLYSMDTLSIYDSNDKFLVHSPSIDEASKFIAMYHDIEKKDIKYLSKDKFKDSSYKELVKAVKSANNI